MRRVFVTLLAVVLALTAVGTTAAAPAAPKGTLRIAVVSDATLNPFTFPQQIAAQMVSSAIFGKLTRYNPGDMKVVGDLATAWTPEQDGKAWLLKLRRGVKWHDGQPFTAADVKFTLESIVNPKVKALYRSALNRVQRVDIVDDYTVRVHMSEPFPSFPIVVGWWIIPMTPKHLLDGKDLNDLSDFAQKPVGTGQFVFKEAVKASHVLVEANMNYWAGPPKLKNVVFKVLPDVNTIMAQFRAGELDLAQVEAVNMEALKGVPHMRFRLTEQPSTFFIALNNTRFPFTDRRVRMAMMYGLNRDAIIKQIYKNTARIAGNPYAKAFGQFVNPALKPYPYDVARAKKLLAEAGFKPGAGGILEKDGKPLAFELMVDR
ncbi:MAG: ABC transporter substrate-binding protein, partial [Armatimonadetes bacterium]|nr:ABC transporter substrate-binding protein [Armatimonadota bacterium]